MSVTLSGKLRKQTGKKATKNTRKEGLLPAVLYGQKNHFCIAVNLRELSKIIKQKGLNALIDLALKGETSSKHKVLLKDFQSHPLEENWVHADFFEVDMHQTIKVQVPVKLIGAPPGVKKGGILNHVIQELSLECLPANIPEIIQVSVEKLDLEEAIHVSDIEVPEKVAILNPPTATVAIIHLEKVVEEEKPEGEEGETAPIEGGETKPSGEETGKETKVEKK